MVTKWHMCCFNHRRVCGDAKRIGEFRDAVEALKDVNVITSSGWRIEEAKNK